MIYPDAVVPVSAGGRLFVDEVALPCNFAQEGEPLALAAWSFSRRNLKVYRRQLNIKHYYKL